jgi:mono/diheme cytochrome c family protein
MIILPITRRGILMRDVLKLYGAAMVALALALCGGAARAQDAPAGDAAEGKRLYLAVGCFTCHGRSGQGGAMNGPAPILARTAMPFDGFKAQMRQPSSDMPAYAEIVMSEKQIADIYAFLQTLPGPRPTKDMAIFKE